MDASSRIDTLPALLHPTVAPIDVAALRHNVRLLQDRAGAASVMGVVKADAYGHGAVAVTRVLREEGVRHFAVATVPEAITLREAGIHEPMLVFAAPLPDYLPAYIRYGLDVTVPSRAVAEAVMDIAQPTNPLRVHVKVDTGMGRLGLPPEEVAAVVRHLEATPGIMLDALWTHFATATETADDFAMTQLERFRAVWAEVGHAFAYVHLAHSGGLFHLPPSYTAFDRMLVRIGIALYGLEGSPEAADLHPVMQMRSRVTQVKTIEAGTTISYGRRWTAERRTRIATIGAGYADGYPRLLTNRGEVGIGGQRYPVVGTVCMDMFMVDLGPAGGPAVVPGDEVVLFGTGGPSTYEVARWAETIPYEICCGVAARVPRLYVEE